MDAENNKIRHMFGAYSDALCHRRPPGPSHIDALIYNEYEPETDEEAAIWSELTAPHNYPALLRYVEYWSKKGLDLSADNFHKPILAEAARRWAKQAGDIS